MRRAAVWDLGSSSFQVLVCDQNGPSGLEPVLRRRSLLNLGKAVGAQGSIPAERLSAALAAAKRLRRAADTVRPDVEVVLATAALRDASNGPDVVRRLQGVIGHPVVVLSGEEEARLCFAGQMAGVWTGPGPVLGVDLGGGSFELAVGDAQRLNYATSAPLGATRLYGELGALEVLGADERSLIRRRTTEALADARQKLSAFPGVARRAVVSGGTARALARLATAATRDLLSQNRLDVSQVELPAGQVAELANRLAGLTLRQRLAMPGMPSRRAPMLPVGAAILSALADELQVERFVVSVWGLREGALLGALGKPASR